MLATRLCIRTCSTVALIDLTLGYTRELGPGMAVGFPGGDPFMVVTQSHCDDGVTAPGEITSRSLLTDRTALVAETHACDASLVGASGF